MADSPISSEKTSNNTSPELESNFLGKGPAAEKNDDILYNDFFQESSNGDISSKAKDNRSSMELIVSVMRYVTILVVSIWILFWVHTFIRSSDIWGFIQNYPILCPYLNYDIKNDSSEKQCKNVTAIQKEYTDKINTLENNIITNLTEYIPIKVSSSILDASPEKKFVISTYDTKPNINKLLEAFEKVKSESQSVLWDNITCKGLVIKDGISLSTICTVLGWDIGNDDVNSHLWSSRIEALRFIANLSNIYKYSLILDNPPNVLSIEKNTEKETLNTGFSTRTVLPIQVKYVPLIQKL